MSGAPARPVLRALTFDAAGFLFAARSEDVSQVLPSGAPLPRGTSVVDIIGMLSGAGKGGDRGCVVVFRETRGAPGRVAVTASRAREVVDLDAERLLPLPAFLFQGENPFLGVIPSGPEAIFLLAEPERILAAAGSR